MKSLAFLAALLLASAAALAQTVTFHREPLPVGMTMQTEDTMRLDAAVTVLMQDQEQSFDASRLEFRRYSKTMLALDGDTPVKYRLAYDAAFERAAQPMRGQKESSPPVTASPYILEHLDEEEGEAVDSGALEQRVAIVIDGWLVTREDGEPISEEEEKFLGNRPGGKLEESLRAVLAGRTMTTGEELELDKEMMSILESGFVQGNIDAREVSLRLRALETDGGGQTAVFDFTAVLTGNANIIELEITMEGVLRIGVDNLWLAAFEISGTMTGAGMHQNAAMGMDGDIRMVKRATYSMH